MGGSADKASDSVTVGDKADLSVKAQRADYEFVGWNTDKDAHTALSSCTVNGDVTLYAIFKRTFQVRFYSATNWDYVTATVYNKENSVPVNIPSPESYAGWSALGWCDDSFSVSPEYAEQTTVLLDGHKSFYALYSRNVTLSYDSNGGKNTPPDQTGVQYFNAGSQKQKVSFTLAADPYRYGYILWCWARNGDFKDLYTAGREILIDEDTTMKAVWEKFDMLCDINCTYTQSDAKHIFEVAVPGLTREATVIAALYDQNLNFMGAVTENFVIGGTTKLSIDKKENAYVAKIFVWNSGMKPLAHISLCDVSFPMGTK